MKKIELKKLIDHVLDALRAFELSTSTLKTYRYSAFSPIKTFFAKKGQHLYSQKTATTFLKRVKERLKNNEISERHYRKLRKAADLLEEYSATGALEWKTRTPRSKIKVNAYFTSILLAYEKNCCKRLAPGTVKCLKSNAFPELSTFNRRQCVIERPFFYTLL